MALRTGTQVAAMAEQWPVTGPKLWRIDSAQ